MAKNQSDDFDFDGVADWRIEKFGRLENDLPAAFPGGPSHKAGSVIYAAPTLVKHPVHNAIGFITPSPMAMALNVAITAAETALKVKPLIVFRNAASPVGTVQSVTPETLPYLFDYFEQCMICVTFSFQALEAFANQIIQSRVKGSFQVLRRGELKDLTADELERQLQTEEKLATVLPAVLGVKTPKPLNVWERFVKLKRVRDSTVHLKKRDAQSLLDTESLFFQFLNNDPKVFPSTALKMIEHFRSEGNRPPWMHRIAQCLQVK